MNSSIVRSAQTSSIYLDNNATTKIDPRVAAVMAEAQLARYANPASQHTEGRRARSAIEKARLQIAESLGCRTSGTNSDRVIFTSGGTEANNFIVHGLPGNRPGKLIVSSIEHPSIFEPAERFKKLGIRPVEFLPAEESGLVSLDAWNEQLQKHKELSNERIALVSVMGANNETGVIQPIEQIICDCRSEGILFHTDAVQMAGKASLSFSKLDVDAMTITAHKFHGPVGIGALITKHNAAIEPQLIGGSQQLGSRPGTEPVVLALGFAEAIRLGIDELNQRTSRMRKLREKLEALLLQSVYPPILIGSSTLRLPHTISLAYEGINRQALQMALDRTGIACSTGSACASGSGTPSHVLTAMKLRTSLIEGAIRLSLSHETTESEIDQAATRIIEVVSRLRK
jgi:cysteine desulfurase